MRRLLLLAALSMVVMLVLAPAAMAQDVDCPQLAPGEAEAILAADPSDPNRLDADNDGIPCESGTGTGTPTQSPATEQYQYSTQPATTPSTALPSSGGISLLLPAALLLVGSGILGLAIARRNS